MKGDAQLELALGVAYYDLRRFDEAADAFLRTIDADQETAQPYTFLRKILDQIPGRLARVTEKFAAYQMAHPGAGGSVAATREGAGCAVGRCGGGPAAHREGHCAGFGCGRVKAAQLAPADAGNPLQGPAPVCLRTCSKRVGPAGGWNPKSSTRCQLPVTMLAVGLKWERTPELTQLAKKWPSGRRVTSRGMLCWPSGAKVSE